MQNYKEIINQKVQTRLRNARQMSEPSHAISEYIKVLFLDPNCNVALRDLANSYVQIGDLSAAIVCLQYSCQINHQPEQEERLKQLILLRGQGLFEQQSWSNFLEGTDYERFGAYLALYHQDIKKLRKDEEVGNSFESNLVLQAIKFFQRAVSYSLANYLIYSLQEIENAMKICPNVAEFFLFRGKLLWALNKEPQGNLDYWKAESLNPNHPEVQEFLNFIHPKINTIIQETKFLIVQNAFDKCQLNIKKGLELHPTNTDLLLIKSYLHRQNAEYEQALMDLDICQKNCKEPDDQVNNQIALTYNEMAMFLFQKKKYDDALTLFNEALKYKPKDWGILVNRGDAYKELGRDDEAIFDYQNALKINPTNPDIMIRVVQMLVLKTTELFNKRHYESALIFLDQALSLIPGQAQVLMKRGKCYLELHRYPEALSDFQEVLKQEPNNFEAQNYVMQMKPNQKL